MSETPSGTKRALLISIGTYNEKYPHWNLDGCGNDRVIMKRLLERKFGFEHITSLVDEQATRDAILAAFEDLVSATGEGDIVVIHYAGHGSQMTCREGDETDGLDETLVPYDSGRAPDENRDITDDEINVFLQRLGEKTSYTTLIFDCCHSGTITRDAFGGKTRSIPNDLRDPEHLPDSPLDAETITRQVRNPGPSGWLSLSEKYVLIAGCADEEESAEKKADGNTFGALTWYLSKELERAGPGTTYRDVFEGLASRVTANHPRQHPQMEGRLNRELFGVRDIEPMRYVPVIAREGDVVTLGAGVAQGMSVGSRWAIVAQGTAEVTDETGRLGEVEITSVRPVESEAKLTVGDAPDAIVPGCRAVETAHAYGDQRLGCEVVAPDGDPSAQRIRDALAASNLLAEAASDAAVRIYVLEPRPEVAEGADVPVPQLGALEGAAIAAVGEQGEVVVPVERLGERGRPGDDEAALIDNLETLARYRMALALTNEDPGSALRGAVEMTLYRQRPDEEMVLAEPENAGGQIVFEVGDIAGLQITNVSDEPLYYNLVDFDPAGAVTALWPPAGSNEVLAPGASLSDLLRFRARLPEKLPEASLPVGDRPLEGLEVLKLFVTREPADFSFLNNTAFRSVEKTPSEPSPESLSPFEQLVRSASGVTTRTIELLPSEPKADWATVELPFVIREKVSEPLTADGSAIEIGSARVVSRGLTGEVASHGWQSARGSATQMVGDRLTDALAGVSIETRQTLEIRGARASEPAMRSIGAERPEVELELADPGTDFGQMLLSTNESGLMTWHFPEPESEPDDDAPAMRSIDGRPARSRRFVVDATVEAAPDEPRTRGLIGAVGKKFIQELVFPLMDPVVGRVGDYFAGRFEKAHRPYRLRTFTPDDHLSADADVIADEDGRAEALWDRLQTGRSLLMLHGTFSRSHTGFGSLPRDFIESLHRQYDGRVFAFDHYTLSEDPRQNAEWLIRHLPEGVSLDVDILCHARGGLVARALAERQGELTGGATRLRVGKIIFAGVPNAGTQLADPKHLGSLIDRYTNVLNFFDFIPIDTGVVEVLETIISVGKQLAMGTMKGLDGIRAMAPGGDFQKWLDKGTGMEGTRYFALSSDFRPEDPALQRLAATTLARKVFDGSANDLIVPTAAVVDRRRAARPGQEGEGGAMFPIANHHVFEGGMLAHFDYFGNPEAREKIASWLSA